MGCLATRRQYCTVCRRRVSGSVWWMILSEYFSTWADFSPSIVPISPIIESQSQKNPHFPEHFEKKFKVKVCSLNLFYRIMTVMVPRRRGRRGLDISLALKLFDINFLLSKTRLLILYGFAPTVVLIGMYTEPRPASWFDLVNIMD